jgi:hypothetical protein
MIIEIIEQTIMITGFVLVMMLLIEYLTVQTKGNWSKTLQKSTWLQVIFAAIMGIIPGCLGAFVVVSMYAHKILNFAALITVMIATSGDEAFVMFAMIPGTALKLTIIIFVIAIVVGFIFNLLMKNKTLMKLPENHLKFHKYDPDCVCFEADKILMQFKNISFQRALLVGGGLILLIFLISGQIGPHEWNWKRITFLIVTAIGLFIVSTVPDHFLKEHLWEHVIKKHFLKIFLWTLGAFIAIHILNEYLNVEEWIKSNYLIILMIAVLIGIIPESGPHIVFITLFLNGTIPFSILLANSIVQDGHGAIPLLAESQKSFMAMKLINILVGLIVGFSGYFFGF